MSTQASIIATDVTVEFDVPEYRVTTLKELVVNKLKGRHRVRKFKALDEVSLTVSPGESLAILGHNGSGKSTMLKVLAGIIQPPRAKVLTRGRIAPMIELGAGFDGDLSGFENIKLSCLLMGLTTAEIADRMSEIVRFSELEKFIHMPVRNYSSGMYARLGFACATAVDPDVLLVDEVLAVGDSNFAKKCLEKIEGLRQKGTSVVLVSHDEGVVQRFCERAVVFSEGKQVFEGPIAAALKANSEVMTKRYVASLPKDQQDVLSRRHEAVFSAQNLYRSNGSLPEIGVVARVEQSGSDGKLVDFGRPFSLVFGISISNAEALRDSLAFSMALSNERGRVAGFTSTSQAVPEGKDVVLQVSFNFENGIQVLSAGHFNVGFCLLDKGMARTLYNELVIVVEASNSQVESNWEGDLLILSSFVSNVTSVRME